MDENNKNRTKTAKEAFLSILIPEIETIQDLQDLSESLYGFKFSILALRYKKRFIKTILYIILLFNFTRFTYVLNNI